MTSRPHARLLAIAVTLLLALGVFLAALLGPAETLAQTHKPTCQSSAHARKRSARACTQPSHKVRAQTRRAPKHHPKRKSKKTSKSGTPTVHAVAAQCEDGSAPVQSAEGSFSCGDGSEPQCENGASPTPSHNGKSLLCPVSTEAEAGAGETECEEEDEALGCTPGSDSSEQDLAKRSATARASSAKPKAEAQRAAARPRVASAS